MKAAKYGLLLSILLACASAQSPKGVAEVDPPGEISGMYSFEREGEFVQINVEVPSAKETRPRPLSVTGFISRYADTDSDRGAFLDYFITKGSLEGNKLIFTTKTIHGLSYEFSGTVARGTAVRGKDGYYEIRGTLTQNAVVEGKITSAKSREMTMKLYPDLDQTPARAKSY